MSKTDNLSLTFEFSHSPDTVITTSAGVTVVKSDTTNVYGIIVDTIAASGPFQFSALTVADYMGICVDSVMTCARCDGAACSGFVDAQTALIKSRGSALLASTSVREL